MNAMKTRHINMSRKFAHCPRCGELSKRHCISHRTLRENGMFLETDSDFDTDSFKMKARLDFGIHMARWEGWYKNPGA